MMKVVKFVFVDPNENKDIKKKNGYDVDCDAFVVKADNSKSYCKRIDAVELIRKSYVNHELIYGNKKIINNNTILRYSFNIVIEGSVKGCIIIDMPTTMLMMDNDAKTMKIILDKYEGRAADRRKREYVRNAFIAAGGLALLMGFGKVTMEGILREVEANDERNRQWYEDYISYNGKVPVELDIDNLEHDKSYDCSVSSNAYIYSNDYSKDGNIEKVFKKTR